MDELEQLLTEYQRNEGHARRGPRFTDVAYEIERRMRNEVIQPRQLVEWFGQPDHRVGDDSGGTLVYLFDHQDADLCRDEWYFAIDDGRVVNTGFNRRGINEWPEWTGHSK